MARPCWIQLPAARSTRHLGFALGFLLSVAATVVLAHEGHTPLPSKGAKVDVTKGLVTLSAEARFALDVQTTEIGTIAPPDSILAYATLVTPWKQHAFAVSRLPGRIVSLAVKPGQMVEAGLVLAEVESQESELLRLEIQNTGTELKLAEQVYTGLKESTVPESNILTAEVQVKQAKNTLELAQAKWLALGLPPNILSAIVKGEGVPSVRLPIRSPIGGTVIHADLAIGKVVEPGEHLFEIVDLSIVWARIGVLERDINRVAKGQPVTVHLTAYPGESFRGTVAIVGQYLDPVTHLNDVWVEFRNELGSEARLLLGLSGQARIELPAEIATKTVPATALVNDGVDRFVLVEEANAAGLSEYRKRSVVVVRETPDVVVIRSANLFPGDRVVTIGGHELGTFFTPGVLHLSPESIKTIGLNVEPVTTHAVETVIEIPGMVDLPPDRRSVASARLPGTILSIRAEPGQVVKAGDVLAEVFSLDLLNLQLDLLRESLATNLAAAQLSRLQIATDSVPKRRLVEAEAVHITALNRRDSLRQRLELLGLTGDQITGLMKQRRVTPALPVRAADAGIVVRFDRVIGQSVRADEPLFEVHDLTKPLIQAFVSEQDLTRVRLGQTARVRLVSDPTMVMTGKVVRSGRTFGTTDRTMSVWIDLDRLPSLLLRQNQTGQVTLVLGSQLPTLSLPDGAILREGTQTFVFVQHGDSFERRAVELGRADDRFVEIRSGLKLGEVVAVTAVYELQTALASVK